MKNTLHQVLRESQSKIQTFEEQVKRFEHDPMILIKEMFVDQDFLLPILITGVFANVYLLIRKNNNKVNSTLSTYALQKIYVQTFSTIYRLNHDS